ncbi:pirin family protein [Candidatus Sulfurimonas marisnigri]|uniref:Pirin family protein n=1 Tax=Candidatus Sulfurimonas marisnigri TaxID=2740405 RepID=A0A7S7M1U3_9BACT|nr:pirin family protein [Candidatus Sulfurimonas marisnigri]QOY55478.1 pirin family protein [Candidatus Sulfurimonas marisnigri]
MIKHIPFNLLYLADHGWLKSRFHFSFAEYRDFDNIHYGPLRVMNDDLIKGNEGFGEHPHNDMEIITYVLRGELTHQDSMGHMESLSRGSVQYMSAGTGITHSEINAAEEELHLIQTWIIPNEKGLKPQYGSREFELEDRHNKWLHVVGPEGSGAKIKIYQDASMYASEMDDGKNLEFKLLEGRALYVKVMEGSAKINGIIFAQGDAAKVEDESLHVQAIKNAHLLLVELAKG